MLATIHQKQSQSIKLCNYSGFDKLMLTLGCLQNNIIDSARADFFSKQK